MKKPNELYGQNCMKDTQMNECVIWDKFIDGEGYGRKYLPRNGGASKYIPAHKWVYQQHYGEVPKGMVVRHKCDVRSCVNIEHLEIGTPYDNIQDMISRGRSNFCGRPKRKGG